MRKIIAVLLTVCCLTGVLSGCSGDAVLSENEYYSVIREGGTYYLQFHKDLVDDAEKHASATNLVPVEYPPFSSVAEMKQGILTGQIKGDFDTTEYSENYIAWIERAKDENGRVKMFDPNDLYELQVPDDVAVKRVVWQGGFYSFQIVYNGLVTNAGIGSEEAVRREYERLCGLQEEPEVRCASADEHFLLRYNAGCGDNAVRREYQVGKGTDARHVVEIYHAEYNAAPQAVVVFGRENGSCFYALIVRPKKLPTEEWLLSFGLDKRSGRA